MLLGILIVTVNGGGSEEVLGITSLFSSITDGVLSLLFLEEDIYALVVYVGRDNCGAREESGCCSSFFSSVKEAISYVS